MQLQRNNYCGHWIQLIRYAPPTSNPDQRPFDLETGMRVASKVGNLHSQFGHARPLVLELFAMYADKSNVYCPLPYGWGHNSMQ